MPRRRPDATIVLTAEQRQELESVVRARTSTQALGMRAKIVLLTAEGIGPWEIGRRLEVSQPTVRAWRQRYVEAGLAGLGTEARPGRPRSLSDEQVATLIQKLIQTRPKRATHWSVRSFAAEQGLSKDMAHRLMRVFGLQPHRSKAFKLSTDPLFVEKVRDIVGLYLRPPEHALVLCVDEKSQVQALERTQPVLPMGLGYPEGVTHDYVRHGTTTLFAALNIANGQVFARCKPRHRHQEFLAFLREVEANVPAALAVHLILDNYASHKHPKVRAWLARRPRFHLHFTPTYSSWLNQVERWFALITQQAIRRNSFTSVRDLLAQIRLYTQNYNQHATAFRWVATADDILEKLRRLTKVISATPH
jgi:transposase